MSRESIGRNGQRKEQNNDERILKAEIRKEMRERLRGKEQKV